MSRATACSADVRDAAPSTFQRKIQKKRPSAASAEQAQDVGEEPPSVPGEHIDQTEAEEDLPRHLLQGVHSEYFFEDNGADAPDVQDATPSAAGGFADKCKYPACELEVYCCCPQHTCLAPPMQRALWNNSLP